MPGNAAIPLLAANVGSVNVACTVKEEAAGTTDDVIPVAEDGVPAKAAMLSAMLVVVETLAGGVAAFTPSSDVTVTTIVYVVVG
jgi:hypothetical protein